MEGSDANENCMAANSRSDDLFANSSTETVVQNIDFSLILAEAAMHQEHTTQEVSATADASYRAECFVSDVCNFALQLHCPFCCKYFAFEFMLKEHIKLQHVKYWEMLRSDNNIVLLHSCLFCHAKYYKKRVLLKHILYSHQEIMVAVSKKDFRGTQLCLFCPYNTISPFRSKLLAHVEQNHSREFETLIDGMYIHNKQLETTIDSSQHTFGSSANTSFQQSHMSRRIWTNYDSVMCVVKSSPEDFSPVPRSGRSVRKKLRFDQPQDEEPRALATPCTRPSKWKTFFSFLKIKKNRDNVTPRITTSTPKSLCDRQTLMDNDIDYIDCVYSTKIKERSVNKNQGKKFSFNIFSKRKSKYHSLGVTDKHTRENGISPTKVFKRNVKVRVPACGNSKRVTLHNDVVELSCKWAADEEYKVKQFKCAICLEAFGDNVSLLCHAKRHHNGPLRILQPSFKCGLCDATFYKNSFLLRHCKFHHTPLCLRS